MCLKIHFEILGVRNNLHLVISLESTSNNFQDILKMYPALHAKTEFIWIQDFSEQSKQMLCEDVIKLLQSNNALSGYGDATKISTSYFEAVSNDLGVWSESPRRSVQLIKSYYFIHAMNEKKKLDQQSKLQVLSITFLINYDFLLQCVDSFR